MPALTHKEVTSNLSFQMFDFGHPKRGLPKPGTHFKAGQQIATSDDVIMAKHAPLAAICITWDTTDILYYFG